MGKRAKVTFDDVRAVLYDPPSMASWRRLWSLLSKMEPEPLQNEVLPYVQDLLKRWPGGMRPLPNAAWPLLWGTEQERDAIGVVVRLLAPLADSLLLLNARPTAAQVIALARSPWCKNMVRLELSMTVRDGLTPEDAVRALATSSLLDSVKHFVWRGLLPQKEGRVLFQASWFRHLETLSLSCRGFDDEPLAITMPCLRELAFTNGAALVDWLVQPDALPNVRKISVLGSVSAGTTALVEMLDNAPLLEELWLRVPSPGTLNHGDGLKLDDITRQVLLSPKLRARLKRLHLHESHVGGLNKVLKSGAVFERLEVFRLTSSFLLDAEAAALVRNPKLRSIHTLSVRTIPMTLAVIDSLVSGPLASGLRSLELINAKMRPEALNALLQAQSLEGLEHLDITTTGTPMLAKTLGVLLEPHALVGLRSLAVNGPNLTDALVEGIEANPSFAGLESLAIFPSSVSVQGVYRRLTALPWSKRLEASQHLFGTMKQGALLKVFKGIKESVPSTERLKSLLVERAALLAMDDVRLAAMLSCEATLKTLDKRVLKATARGLKLKGYTKLTQAQLVTQLSEALNSEERGLLAMCRSERVGVS